MEQELEKERDKVLLYKNSYFTAPRHPAERRDSDEYPFIKYVVEGGAREERREGRGAYRGEG